MNCKKCGKKLKKDEENKKGWWHEDLCLSCADEKATKESRKQKISKEDDMDRDMD